MKYEIIDTRTGQTVISSMVEYDLERWIKAQFPDGRLSEDYDYTRAPSDGHDLVRTIHALPDGGNISLYRERESAPVAHITAHLAHYQRVYSAYIPGANMCVEFDEMVVDDNPEMMTLRFKGMGVARWADVDNLATDRWIA